MDGEHKNTAAFREVVTVDNTDNLRVLEDTQRHLKDAAYNLRTCWDGAEGSAAEYMLNHIDETETMLKMEIRRIK